MSIAAPGTGRPRRATGGDRRRPGFTLLELMIVTAILSLLALLAVGPLIKARERTMIAAANVELTQMVKAAEMYRILNGRMPAEAVLLGEVGHVKSRDIMVCRYELTRGASGDEDQLRIDLRHAGAARGVTTTHPQSNGVTTEIDLSDCAEGATQPDTPGAEQPGEDEPGGQDRPGRGPPEGRGPGDNPGRGGGRGNQGNR